MNAVEAAGGRPPERKESAATSRRFGEALRAASGKASRPTGVAAGRARMAAAAVPASELLESGRATVLARSAATRRAASDRLDDALKDRRDGFREEVRLAGAPPPPPAANLRAAEAVSAPELRALVRTLPVAIQTFGVRSGAPLALSVGRALDVELRASPRGIEVVLRPEPRLARASEAELPAVVAALAGKGITVSRAEVRVRGAGPAPSGGAGPRVDLAPGLR